MTEKRFYVDKSPITHLFVPYDKEKEFVFEGVENGNTIMQLVGLLNNALNENEQLKSDCDYRWKKYCNTRKEMLHENEQLKRENEQLKEIITGQRDTIKKDNEWENKAIEEIKQLKQQLKEFEDYVYSDEKILCYTCVNCLSKGIYEVECSEKGKVDVHGSCFSYWENELKGDVE